MEVKLEKRKGDGRYLLDVFLESSSQFLGKDRQHLDRVALLLEDRGANADVLPFKLNKLPAVFFRILRRVIVVLVENSKIRLELGALEQSRHDGGEVGDKVGAHDFAETGPGGREVGSLGIIGVGHVL